MLSNKGRYKNTKIQSHIREMEGREREGGGF